EALLEGVGSPPCEKAMIEISRYWVQVERGAALPGLEALRPLGERIIDGEFWPETFLVFAALQLRAGLASGAPDLADLHGTNEFTLRSNGLANLLPAMQLLREECLSGARPAPRKKPLSLPEHELMLLLPTVATWRMNGAGNGGKATAGAPRLKRIQAVRDLHLARDWLERGRFDLAIGHLVDAMEVIESHDFGFLRMSEADFIARIARECRKRRRFVDAARGWLNRLGEAGTRPAPAQAERPMGLTPSELGVLRRLPASTSNKALARDIGVSEATIKFHLRNIYRKLGVHKRRAAIDVAREKGVI
ncbi:MAG TPA: helix-turn-helix transcriptional regulator, partial [Aliiroseovarius sp.]|nr:helix-turn-helix transcriptional regulator [Aliiroseovarius sp.]